MMSQKYSVHFGSTNNQYGWDGAYRPIYPPPPNYSPSCQSNVDWDTLPESYPMRRTILGSSSLKQLYWGPQYYPSQAMDVPKDTLYGLDTSVFEPNGKRQTYGTKLYPITHRSPREVVNQSVQVLPMPDIYQWTRYPTLSDGAWGR
jgi:hypothetical protein